MTKGTVTINIAEEYTTTPGARYERDGEFSGEEFRRKFLERHFQDKFAEYKVRVILDGVEGYATSFLEEAFGGLARKYGIANCMNRLEFISEEDGLLIDEIKGYIEEANG
jgi:STAS-like domain of unknown function (DUF4325)